MLRSACVLASLGVLSALTAACTAGSEEATSSADAVTQKDCAELDTCVVAETALTGTIKEKLATQIDSGWLEKGPIKVRTKFTIDPPKDEPLVSVSMPKGAVLEASWSPSAKGALTIRARNVKPEGTANKVASETGNLKVRYTLVPTLEGKIYGVSVNYDSTQLLEKVIGKEFKYDAQSETKFTPWGFEGAATTVPAPKLSESTIFGIPFTDLGIDEDTAEGQLAIQAIARPTFTYKTKGIQLDNEAVRSADSSTKVTIGDYDAVDVIVRVEGELGLTGELDVRPVVAVDTVAGLPTLGLVNYSFSVTTKSFAGTTPVQFEPANIHIPLPNVKVPTIPFSLGTAESDARLTKKVTIENTGERAAVFTAESSDPKFIVASTPIKIEPKSKVSLEVAFQPEGSGPSSANITIKSNDPDSPEQSFQVSANGPAEPDPVEEPEEDDAPVVKAPSAKPKSDGGCSMGATGTGVSSAAPWGIALGVALLARRRKR